MKQVGRSVGWAADYNHLFSLTLLSFSLSSPRVHTAALRYSKATTAVDSTAALPLFRSSALPLTSAPLCSSLLLSAPLCLTALARVKRCALACLSTPLAPRGYSYQPIRTARGKRYYCCTTRNRTTGVIVEA